MKRNIAIGIFLISVFTLGSCSINQLASNKNTDNVYFSEARAGNEPVYTSQQAYTPVNDQNSDDVDDDYFYYDDYASRINRFSYASPFGYYDDFYGGYYNYPYNAFTIGFGYGYGYGGGYYGYGLGYGGWGLGLGYGYGGWGLGLGYGYGGYAYNGWRYGYGGYGGYYGYGGYAANGTARPVRNINNSFSTRRTTSVNSTTTGIGYIPGGRNHRTTPIGTSNNGASNTTNNGNNNARPARTDDAPSRPVVQQPVERVSAPSPAASESRGTSSSSGGGGARPSRP